MHSMQYYARYAIDILIQVCICMDTLLEMLYLLCTGLYIHRTCIVSIRYTGTHMYKLCCIFTGPGAAISVLSGTHWHSHVPPQ